MFALFESVFLSLGINPALGYLFLFGLAAFGTWFAWLSYETWLHESVQRNYYDEIGAYSKNLDKHRRALVADLERLINEARRKG